MNMEGSSKEHIRFTLDENDFDKNGTYKSELYNFDDLIVPEIGKFKQLVFPHSLYVGGRFVAQSERVVVKGNLVVNEDVVANQLYIGNDFLCNESVTCKTIFVDEKTQIGERLICNLFSGVGFTKIRNVIISDYFYFGEHFITEETIIKGLTLSKKLPYVAIDGDLNGCDLLRGNERNPQRLIFFFTEMGVLALNNKNGSFDFIENVKGVDILTRRYIEKIWKEKA